MCRLIVASGRFDARDIFLAALAMSRGETVRCEGPTRCHPNGWGAAWYDEESGDVSAIRDGGTMHEDVIPDGVRTDLLAVHVRHATLAHNQGLSFAHPLRRAGDGWHFMHNGFMPTAYEALGRAESVFDSAEYFDYIVPPGSSALDEAETMARLAALSPGGTCGNAVAMNSAGAYVIHWAPHDTPYPGYFTMHRYTAPGLDVVSSEAIPALAPLDRWEPVPARVVLRMTRNATTNGEDRHVHDDRVGPRHPDAGRRAA